MYRGGYRQSFPGQAMLAGLLPDESWRNSGNDGGESFMKKMLTVVAGVFLSVFALGTQAEVHAVLVGVSEYPSLKDHVPDLQLRGPANDVVLLRDLLRQRGIPEQNIRVLTEGKPETLPTRANILKAVDDVVARVGEGDEVFLLFAGHGSQQPAKFDDEPDGFDEIFLPRDIGAWDGKKGEVANAISDNEIRDRVRKLRERGALVWAVFDSCHSGTMTRGVGVQGIRYRNVEPATLGVPAKPGLRAPDPARLSLADAAALKGGDIGFYAAQTTELAPEAEVDLGSGDKRVHGVFTWMLAKGLQKNASFTYRQLGQYILQSYSAMGFSSPTPLFEGSALDRPVFGATGAAPVNQWPLGVRPAAGGSLAGAVAAGSLDELSVGDVLLILPDALSTAEQALGEVTVASVSPLESTLGTPQGKDGKPLAWKKLSDSKVWLRRHSSPRISELSVAYPAFAKDTPKADRQKVQEALSRLEKKLAGKAIRFVRDQPADLVLHVEKGLLYLLPRSGVVVETETSRSTHIVLADKTAPAIADMLEADYVPKIARTTNLMRLAGVFPGDSSIARAVSAQLRIRKADSTEFAPADIARPFNGVSGDELMVEVKNDFAGAVDVTVLYIDAAWGITALYPLVEGQAARVEAGGRIVAGGNGEFVITGVPAGSERVMVIAVPAVKGEAPRDYTNLEQAGVSATRGGVEAGRDPFDELVNEAATLATRGMTVTKPMPRVTPAVSTFTLQVHQ